MAAKFLRDYSCECTGTICNCLTTTRRGSRAMFYVIDDHSSGEAEAGWIDAGTIISDNDLTAIDVRPAPQIIPKLPRLRDDRDWVRLNQAPRSPVRNQIQRYIKRK